MDSINHGFKKGNKLLCNVDGNIFYVTYLGYSELDYDCFIGETEDGFVDDTWRWDEVVRRIEEE